MKRWGLALVVMNLSMGVVIMSCHEKKKGLEGEVKVGELRFVETNRFEDSEWLRAGSVCEEEGKRWAAGCTELRTGHEPVMWKEGEEWVIRFKR